MSLTSDLLAHKIENHPFYSQLPCQPSDIACFQSNPFIGLLVNASFTREIGHLEVRNFRANVARGLIAFRSTLPTYEIVAYGFEMESGVSYVEDTTVDRKNPMLNSETTV